MNLRSLVKRKFFLLCLLFAFTAISVLYTNCGSFKSNSNDFEVAYLNSLSCEGRLYVVYKSGFHPFFQSAGCKNCHSTISTNTAAPADFADPTPSVGFDSFFKDGYGTNAALFATLTKNATTNHQAAGSPSYTEKVQRMAAQWDGEMALYDDCQAQSIGQVIRRTTEQPLMGASQALATLSFDLSKDISKGTPIQGVTFTIEVEYFKDANGNEAYRTKNPKIQTGANAVFIEDIAVFVDQVRYGVGTTYRSISKTIPANSTVDLVDSATTAMIIQPPNGVKAQNLIAFEFKTLKFVP